jgi:hypothetical protein
MSVTLEGGARDGPGSNLESRIVTAIEAETGVDPLDKRFELYEAVDPDALRAIFADLPDGTPRDTGHVAFEIAGCRVVVDATGTVTVAASGE